MSEKSTQIQQNYSESREYSFYLDAMYHDLLNFNQAVLGYLELVLGGKSSARDAKHYIETAIGQIHNSTQLIEDIRKIAQLGILDDESIEYIYPITVINEAIEDLKLHYPDLKIVVNIHEEQKNLKVRAADILREIILSFLIDAVRFTESEEVTADLFITVPEDEKGMVDITMEDRSTGIPDSQKEALSANILAGVKIRTGRGVGLLLVRAAAKRFGGKIILSDRVPGNPEKGVRITLRIPGEQQ